MNYIKIKPIKLGELQEINANAICWKVILDRNSISAPLIFSLIFVKEDGGTIDCNIRREMIVPLEVLQQWGADDSVIDDFVLGYSPLFERE